VCRLPLWLTKPHARPTAIRADQLHAGRFKGTLDDLEGRPPRERLACLEQSNRRNPDARLVGQLLLSPAEKAACRAALRSLIACLTEGERRTTSSERSAK